MKNYDVYTKVDSFFFPKGTKVANDLTSEEVYLHKFDDKNYTIKETLKPLKDGRNHSTESN